MKASQDWLRNSALEGADRSWEVPSSSFEKTYIVTLTGGLWKCECTAFRTRTVDEKSDKHIKKVQRWLEIKEINVLKQT